MPCRFDDVPRCVWVAVCLAGLGILGQPILGQVVMTEQRLNDLRQIAQPPPLRELPSDQTTLPQDWLGVVSWNVQVGGTSTSESALRPPMVRSAFERLFGGSYQILAAQEISGAANAAALTGMLPGGAENWIALFTDTTDSQDNGFWLRSGVKASAFSTLFVHSATDSSGRRLVDESRTTHPPVVASFTWGDFDLTLIAVHLTFADGQTQESARELREVLNYLDWYFQQPGHDPDVIICGDFNIPTRLSGQIGSGGVNLDPIFEDDPRFRVGNRRLVATVHEPTSRSPAAQGGLPRNSYDHFILSIDALEEFIQARRVDPEILTADPDDPELRLTSDHFPIVALFRTSGEGVSLDAGPKPAAGITGVVDGASFREAIAAGSWITIFGRELAAATRIWRGDEIINGVLPTSLDEVSVLVNGKPAATFFISPTQLNVQAPNDDALGPVTVQVQHNGVTQAVAMTEMRQAAPGLFTFDPQARKYLAAVHLDGTFAGPDRLFGDAVITRPVKPGEVVLLFGTGFGPTDPPVSAGNVFSGAAPLRDTVRVLMAGIQADVLFAGLSGAGVNQLNVRVPESIPSGDVPVLAETLGYGTQEDAFLRVEGPEGPPGPTIKLTATPDTIEQGQSATLQWMSSNATTVLIDQGIGGVLSSGSRTVTPMTTTTYTVTATGPGGTASVSITVVVTAAPAPTVIFTASPQAIQAGQSATLQWTSSNATTVSIDQGIGVVISNGSRTVTPTTTTTYMITATGPGGTTSQSVTVVVSTVPAPTVTLTASPQTIQAGQSATLQWTSTNATSNATTRQINQGIGSVAATGSRMVSPTQTTTYTITAQGPGGTRSASVTITVTQSNFGPCGSKTTCGQMTSCAEALHFLNVCNVNSLDGDDDGVPCESICPGG
jgi:uncharacterized protein (TIGR03437 family)